jgi:hypothetical protein
MSTEVEQRLEQHAKVLAELKEKADNILKMHFLAKSLKVEHGLLSVQVARATDDYFDMDYETRMKFLGAPSTFALCKTIFM